ncbi:unnamed protein product [Phytophthora fragariaefolia]|uniref:Unnamed protein product n=1 Tax=Phytophthora fragariaefolia TaxID=1490495 RepID=A0A9W6X0K3_9STRA|nr:unnamed protein product [Phytophthora fragariaefolia]
MAERSISVRSFGDDVLRSGAIVERSVLPGSGASAPILSQIHVSCYVTAANRATPVFEILPQHNCVRVVNKGSSDASSGASVHGGIVEAIIAAGSGGATVPSVDWNFHSVFSSVSPSHAIDFFTEITLPALRTARDGINSNIVVWGVHPTQKFRLLFGKSVGGGGFAPQPEMAVNDVVELYGQLVGMLHAFFSQLDLRSQRLQDLCTDTWRLGISSWIIVNNQAIDLLKTIGTSAKEITVSSTQAQPLSFVSLEANSLATAFRIVQTAKTNRILRKQNAESVHFFVRLALFHGGQVSTVHLVDLIDQKDFQDSVLQQEKDEFYNILQGLRQPLQSPRRSGNLNSVSDGGGAGLMGSAGKMIISNFMQPLLTANAKTFLYANVIDSRSSLRESVQMLDAVVNIRGFACVCKPLRGITFEQLRFQAPPDEFERLDVFSQAERIDKIVLGDKSMLAVNHATSQQVGTSLRERSSFVNLQEKEAPSNKQPPSKLSKSVLDRTTESEAMGWLSAFAQRKRDILGGSIDTFDMAGLTSGLSENVSYGTGFPPSCGQVVEKDIIDQSSAPPDNRDSISDLYETLRESLEDVKEIEQTISESPKGSYCSLHSSYPDHKMSMPYRPLPITDEERQQEGFTQAGYSRSTIGGIARYQLQQSHQQNEENSSMLSHLTLNRAVSKADSPVLGPEVDVREITKTSSPMSSTSVAGAPLPMPSSLLSKPDKFAVEAFKMAGLHPSVLEPPYLNGLDAKTAEKVQAADATLLRKNYDALLSIVREQQQAKEAAEVRASEALHDQEEQRAMFEVQIENMKLANVGLRSKVRALENRTSLPQLFEQYEQELRTLHAQVEELQARNVALELRAGDGHVGSEAISSEIKKKYQQAVEDKLALERELVEYRKKERLVLLLLGYIPGISH